MASPSPISDSQATETGSGAGIAGTGAQVRSAAAAADVIGDIGQGEAWTHNIKRMVEEFLAESLTDQRQRRELFNRLSTNALTHDEQLKQLALQSLQASVETANMVGKQAVRHADVAIDRTWNLDEIGSKVVLDNAALSDMVKRTFGTTEMAEIVRGIVASELSKQRPA